MADLKIFFRENKAAEHETGLYLVPDNAISGYPAPWNDFGHEILFGVYINRHGKEELLGTTKVLHRNYLKTACYFRTGKAINASTWEITHLMVSDETISLGTTIDFYKNLNYIQKRLQISVESMLQGLCDASYLRARNILGWDEWPGYESALMRNTATAESLLAKGVDIAYEVDTGPAKFILRGMQLPPTFDHVEFEFSRGARVVKDNINVIIGKNGLGKTKVLDEVIRSVTGLTPTKEANGKFLKVVVAAFSPFEEFLTRSQYILLKDHASNGRRDINDENQRQDFIDAYTYIGFKNQSAVFDKSWPKKQAALSLQMILLYDQKNEKWNRASRFQQLIKTLSLALDFDDVGFYSHSDEFISAFWKNINFTAVNFDKGLYFTRNARTLNLSSGQRMYTYLIPPLIAEIDDETLVVLDEPELYLHPELEIGLIDMLKSLLSDTRSYALIATHSALMVRETHQARVTILREGPKDAGSELHSTLVVKPKNETFGASLEKIIGESFNDYFQKKPFEEEIDEMVDAIGSLNDAIHQLYPKIGTSGQQYLLSKRPPSAWNMEINDGTSDPSTDE
ncbi:AAA family ATPase [Siccibacter turicensis]|uniref:AAA family ATPase n=1 Tax=Siccibacter turicensis TaxID=357233 RepID=UPI003F5469A0